MKNAILLHGKPGEKEYYDTSTPSCSNYHWFPWLQKQLIVEGIKTDTPEVPEAYNPQYQLWVKEVERFEITPETILVGHSCGGGFWVRYLSERPELKVGKVVLVAPSLGLNWDDRSFFDYKIDPNVVSRTKGVTIITSDNDKPATLDAVEIFKKEIKDVQISLLKGMGHFTHKDMDTSEFPELLQEILR